MTKSNLWKKEFVLVYGPREDYRVCHSRKACQQVAGGSREPRDLIFYCKHEEMSGCISYSCQKHRKQTGNRTRLYVLSVPLVACFLKAP